MEGIQSPAAFIAEQAKNLKALDARISELNAEAEALKSRREKVSESIVKEVEKLNGDNPEPITSFEIDGVGVVKITTTAYPKILDIEAFIQWCGVHETMAPQLSVNAKTLSSWWDEQIKINRPLPGEDIASVFWKSRARVNKSL